MSWLSGSSSGLVARGHLQNNASRSGMTIWRPLSAVSSRCRDTERPLCMFDGGLTLLQTSADYHKTFKHQKSVCVVFINWRHYTRQGWHQIHRPNGACCPRQSSLAAWISNMLEHATSTISINNHLQPSCRPGPRGVKPQSYETHHLGFRALRAE